MDEKGAVYGEVYDSALTEMQMINKSIENHSGIGFQTEAECAAWASEHLLDVIVIGRSSRQYFYVTHRGDILFKSAWIDAYCDDILFVWTKNKHDEEKVEKRRWIPQGIKHYNKAKINGEKVDRDRAPMYHRDYFTPSGYFDRSRGTFNIAHPFPSFARQTNRDTSHIYALINAIAGECTLHLLAWLRMKIINPCSKTEVIPIIVSRAQGTGKTTFAEVICKGLFGKHNVLVTDQYDSGSRFNADYADALIVCHEEREYEDKRNSAAALKSRATATTIRKENKGLDPVIQDSFTDFIVTSNKDVPVKFDDDEDQRRFMVMEADDNFTRKKNPLADEVFTKLYGTDINQIKQGIPFTEDIALQQQFKHELYTREDIKNTEVRKFPHTAAYDRCRTMPRTSEATEIEAIVRSLAPFIAASLNTLQIQNVVVLNEGTDTEEAVSLSSYLQTTAAMQYFPAIGTQPAYIALCRPLVFFDTQTQKPFPHATVERCMYDCDNWLREEFGIRVYPVTSPIPGGFFGIQGRHRGAPTARFILADQKIKVNNFFIQTQAATVLQERIGERLRVNGKWQPDPNGEFETLNEMKPGTIDLTNKNKNVQYMDTFLFEADDTTKTIYTIEQERIVTENRVHGRFATLTAEKLFQERLHLQLSEAERLFKEGICARIVYSGGKSYHILIRISDPPSNLDEYKWIHASLSIEISGKLNFDSCTTDPARLTRAPIIFERKFEYHGIKVIGIQRCMHTDWNNIYNYNWRPLYKQWLDRPLLPYEEATGKKMIPMKLEYRQAMEALLRGTFWTDSIWNGRRQQCFFPGYRLCRLLGYSHDMLWAEGAILDGLDRYYRYNEQEYWRTRESSDIIQLIDKSVEEMEDGIRLSEL